MCQYGIEITRPITASRWRAMTRIILPLCMLGFLSAGIFAFTLSQNEFLYALLFLSKSSVRTVPIGVVGELIRGDAFYWGQRPPRLHSRGSHLLLLREVLRRGPHRRRRQGVEPGPLSGLTRSSSLATLMVACQ
jgi:hypothetical protein